MLIGAQAIPEIGLGSGQIVYSEVECTGSEERLSECELSEDLSDDSWWCFSHEYDVGVICLDGEWYIQVCSPLFLHIQYIHISYSSALAQILSAVMFVFV